MLSKATKKFNKEKKRELERKLIKTLSRKDFILHKRRLAKKQLSK